MLVLSISGCSVRPLYDNDTVSSSDSHCSIKVDTIANRDGQILRSYLINYLKDIKFTTRKLHLAVSLNTVEKPFAFDITGRGHRLLSTCNAKVTLTDENQKIIVDKIISISTTYNIASTQGEVMLSLYGRTNSVLLKQLAHRIIENIKMSLEK